MEQFCPWEPAKFLIFSSNIPQLLFYSHLPAIFVALLLGFLIFFNNRDSWLGKLLLSISLMFSGWAFFDLILWATNRADTTMFFWSLQMLLEVLVFVFCFYFVYIYLKNEFPKFWINLCFFIEVSPFIILNSTNFSLMGVDLNNCFAIENNIIIFYTYIVEISIILLIAGLSFIAYRKEVKRKKEILLLFFGITSFLLAFSFGNIIGSLTDNWVVAQYGLFGMPVFIAFLTLIIVKYKAFNVKLIATQVLVWGLAILIGSQFFFIKVTMNYILTGITFIATIIFGQVLVRSVKVEIEQKEELAKLNIDLQKLIQQRESLVHLITHKVKGSFTHTKYIFSEILEGSFGLISPELKKVAEFGLESDQTGVDTVDLILNASNLQKGTVKYEMKPVDIKDMIVKTVEEKRDWAEKKGLKVETEITNEDCMISGDSFWLKEVVNNLIENAIRYTKEGTVKIGLKKENGKVLYFVKDTGVGITEEDKKNLFTEGGRGKNSVSVNVDSTGYGLFTVKLIVEAHGGKVLAESEGQGKGSEFSIELNSL